MKKNLLLIMSFCIINTYVTGQCLLPDTGTEGIDEYRYGDERTDPVSGPDITTDNPPLGLTPANVLGFENADGGELITLEEATCSAAVREMDTGTQLAAFPNNTIANSDRCPELRGLDYCGFSRYVVGATMISGNYELMIFCPSLGVFTRYRMPTSTSTNLVVVKEYTGTSVSTTGSPVDAGVSYTTLFSTGRFVGYRGTEIIIFVNSNGGMSDLRLTDNRVTRASGSILGNTISGGSFDGEILTSPIDILGVDGSRQFIIGCDNLSQLPVEWLSFEGRIIDNASVNLTWKTASEINNSHFEVEVSQDGQSWEYVDKVEGSGTCSQVVTYRYVHENAFINVRNGSNRYYRLRQVDFDGRIEYSSVVSVDLNGKAEQNTNLTIIPNPVSKNSLVYVSFDNLKIIDIFDLTGKAVLTNYEIEVGQNLATIDVSDFVQGMYLVSANGGTQTAKLVVTD